LDVEGILEGQQRMRIKNLIESLNAQQRSVPQLPADAKAKHISVLGAKRDPEHPFAGYMVGAGESVEEGRAGVDDTDTVGFSVNSEAAYTAVMKRFGDVIDHDETSGVMYAPAGVWPRIEMIAFDADGEGATRDDGVDESGVDEQKQINEIDATQLQHLQAFSQQVAQMTPAELEAMNQYIMSVGLGAAAGVWGVMGGITFGDMFMNVMRRTMSMAKKKTEVDAEEVIKLQRQIVSIHKRLKTLKSEPAIAKYQEMLKQAYQVLEELEARQDNKVAEGERNEMDTPAVQAALAKMAERHKGEKWSKEQLAALGKRIAARGQKPVKEDITKEDIISKLKDRLGDYLSDISKEIKKDPDLIDKLAAKPAGDQMGPPVKTVTTDDGHEIQIHGNEDDGFRISIKNKPAATKFANLDEAVMACEMYCARRRSQTLNADYVEEAGKDACYNKVKSRYKIWPSAYASGALVRCRKVGAANWGNKSKK
jgi:hypothetical protein